MLQRITSSPSSPTAVIFRSGTRACPAERVAGTNPCFSFPSGSMAENTRKLARDHLSPPTRPANTDSGGEDGYGEQEILDAARETDLVVLAVADAWWNIERDTSGCFHESVPMAHRAHPHPDSRPLQRGQRSKFGTSMARGIQSASSGLRGLWQRAAVERLRENRDIKDSPLDTR